MPTKPKGEVVAKGEELVVRGPEVGHLHQMWIGSKKKRELVLDPVEALYLVCGRNFAYKDERNESSTTLDLFSRFSGSERIFAKLAAYRDWRDRGLIIVPAGRFLAEHAGKHFGNSPVITYPSEFVNLPDLSGITLNFLLPDRFSFLLCSHELHFSLFEKYWFGQLGVYKQPEKDKILKLDLLETLYLAKHGARVLEFGSKKELDFVDLLELTGRDKEEISALYDVYEEWRDRGYVVKTGFKFGTHFRIYFPGASPIRRGKEWIHSKHVIHVFPKASSMLMSEWARAVRVAHSVRKTFIMAVPQMEESDYPSVQFDFVAWWRSNGNVEKPNESPPRFAIIAITEDERLGGRELAAALARAHELGLRLVLAIVDRETSVTYYVAKRIDLRDSRNRYYEVEWIQP